MGLHQAEQLLQNNIIKVHHGKCRSGVFALQPLLYFLNLSVISSVFMKLH